MFRTLPFFAMLLVAACALTDLDEVEHRDHPGHEVVTDHDVVAPADIDWSDVAATRELPTAMELVEQDADALDEKHSAEPMAACADCHVRVWYLRAVGRVQV